MKEAYILHDTEEQLNDIIVFDETKAQRIVNLTNRRITITTAYVMTNSVGLALYEQAAQNGKQITEP
jgi:hypothetical protein